MNFFWAGFTLVLGIGAAIFVLGFFNSFFTSFGKSFVESYRQTQDRKRAERNRMGH